MSSNKDPIFVWKLTPEISDLAVVEFLPRNPVFSLDEASQILPGGAYTTLRTYSRTKVIRIEEHFLRLSESAQRVNVEFHPQVSNLRHTLKKILKENPYPEARVRVTLDLEQEPGCFYITLERLHVPADEDYRQGVRVISRRMQRQNPKAKLTNFLTTATKFRSQLPQGVNELLMVDQNGIILEGLSSNFFGVIAGRIWTIEDGILLGITRVTVIDIAASNEIPVTFEGLLLTQVTNLDECFITSASRGVLPVVQIDDAIIGSGKPGKMTQRLILLFNQWINKNAIEI